MQVTPLYVRTTSGREATQLLVCDDFRWYTDRLGLCMSLKKAMTAAIIFQMILLRKAKLKKGGGESRLKPKLKKNSK